jgi:predicted DNA-binding transcriptional regulator AlpA
MNTKLMNEREAAEYTGLSTSTLRQGRMNGLRQRRCPTPAFVKLGKAIRYKPEDLDAFIEANRIDPSKPKDVIK